MTIRRLALVTDAWHPQINGVVHTLERLVRHLRGSGVEVCVISNEGHKTVGLPSYPEIRVAVDPWRAVAKLRAFNPDAVHIATEGPLGMWVNAWMRRRGRRFTTSFHTRFPEYLSARAPVPLWVGYAVERWFHAAAEHTLVGTHSLIRELQGHRVGRRLAYWPRGVDTDRFHPRHRTGEIFADLPRPIWLYVGRIAREKTLGDFLGLPLDGTKVVVGDGPERAALEERYPDAVWRGYVRGPALASHFASADCFVFPSRTETFGNVVLEAMASGTPVASVPAPGPIDLITPGVNGALNDDLHLACTEAIRCDRDRVLASAGEYTYQASHERFRRHLVWSQPALEVEVTSPSLASSQQ
ncbi:MAG: glycosyltransferase family 1 protein [Myxococcales bacterium FL481]|nr:MAG: glycosyltransferase family 1 protein [Myxococcales bacterium FL481]